MFVHPGHHELPPVAHTTMLRDFPTSLQRYTEAVIPSHPSGSPVSRAANYHQHYVSQESHQHEAASPHWNTSSSCAAHWPTDSPSTHLCCQLAPHYKQQTVIKPQSVVFTSLLCLCVFIYFPVALSSRAPLPQEMPTLTEDSTLMGRNRGRIRDRHLCFLSTWLKTTWRWLSSRCF